MKDLLTEPEKAILALDFATLDETLVAKRIYQLSVRRDLANGKEDDPWYAWRGITAVWMAEQQQGKREARRTPPPLKTSVEGILHDIRWVKQCIRSREEHPENYAWEGDVQQSIRNQQILLIDLLKRLVSVL